MDDDAPPYWFVVTIKMPKKQQNDYNCEFKIKEKFAIQNNAIFNVWSKLHNLDRFSQLLKFSESLRN